MINIFFNLNIPLPDLAMFASSEEEKKLALECFERVKSIINSKLERERYLKVISEVHEVSITVSGHGSRLKLAGMDQVFNSLYELLWSDFPGSHGTLHIMNWDTADANIELKTTFYIEGECTVEPIRKIRQL